MAKRIVFGSDDAKEIVKRDKKIDPSAKHNFVSINQLEYIPCIFCTFRGPYPLNDDMTCSHCDHKFELQDGSYEWMMEWLPIDYWLDGGYLSQDGKCRLI